MATRNVTEAESLIIWIGWVFVDVLQSREDYKKLNDAGILTIYQRFRDFVENQEPLPPEYSAAVDKNFWRLTE